MSSIVHKVKDALKSDHNESQATHGDSQLSHGTGREGLDHTSATGKHGQTSMPGAFDSGVADSNHGHTGHGIATTSDQRHGASDRIGQATSTDHATGYDRKEAAITGRNQQGHGVSKYAQEPTQGSHYQTHGLSSSGHGGGLGTGAAGAGTTGTGVIGLGSREGYSGRGVPESDLMDPAGRGAGSNVMDRTRDDYAAGTDPTNTGSNKLHRREDPRSNYDNSGRSQRHDQEASLTRDHATGATGTTGNTGHLGQTAHGTTTSSSAYGQTHNSASNGPHNSKIMNKLDPRVDSSNPEGYDRDSSRYQEKESGPSQGALAGAAGAAGLGSRSHHHGDPERRYDDSPATGTLDRHDRTHDASRGGLVSGTTSSSTGGSRSFFHCMNCGHKNDASHLRDAAGGAVTGRSSLHCMNCGHRNEVGHMLR
jgi:hypothetical protein